MKKIFLPLILLLFACTSTKIVSSWQEPNKIIHSNNLKKVLVVALFNNNKSSQKVEDQMVAYLGEKGVQSYSYFQPCYNKNDESVIRTKIENDGFDGAVSLRLLDVDKEKIYTNRDIDFLPDYYLTFSGYYYKSWYNEPGYYIENKTYTIETNVYSLKTNKIIWTGITKTTNPDGLKKMTNQIAKVIYKQMLKEGFVN